MKNRKNRYSDVRNRLPKALNDDQKERIKASAEVYGVNSPIVSKTTEDINGVIVDVYHLSEDAAEKLTINTPKREQTKGEKVAAVVIMVAVILITAVSVYFHLTL
jgi:hypothetical protein